jgi:fructose 1,6-bisphosphatase
LGDSILAAQAEALAAQTEAAAQASTDRFEAMADQWAGKDDFGPALLCCADLGTDLTIP